MAHDGSPLDALAVHLPTRRPEQGRHAPVAVAPVPARQRGDVRRQRLLVVPAPRRLPPGRPASVVRRRSEEDGERRSTRQDSRRQR